MKNSVCLIILVVFLFVISGFTFYTLTHKELRDKMEEKVTEKLENVTSNLSGNNLSEIYNVYLNNQKHKLKLSYNVTLIEGIASIQLDIYLDGISIFEDLVASDIVAKDVKAVFEDEEVSKYVKLDIDNIQILTDKEVEYLLIDIGYKSSNYQEKYYLFNSEGASLIEEGILVRDSSVYYVGSEQEELNIFYDSLETQGLAKVQNNIIYAIEAEDNDGLELGEYKYTILDGELKKEKINTYKNIQIREDIDSNENSKEEKNI